MKYFRNTMLMAAYYSSMWVNTNCLHIFQLLKNLISLKLLVFNWNLLSVLLTVHFWESLLSLLNFLVCSPEILQKYLYQVCVRAFHYLEALRMPSCLYSPPANYFHTIVKWISRVCCFMLIKISLQNSEGISNWIKKTHSLYIREP